MVKDVEFDCGFCTMIMSHSKILKAFLYNEASKINVDLNPTIPKFKFYHIGVHSVWYKVQTDSNQSF